MQAFFCTGQVFHSVECKRSSKSCAASLSIKVSKSLNVVWQGIITANWSFQQGIHQWGIEGEMKGKVRLSVSFLKSLKMSARYEKSLRRWYFYAPYIGMPITTDSSDPMDTSRGRTLLQKYNAYSEEAEKNLTVGKKKNKHSFMLVLILTSFFLQCNKPH